MLVQTSATTGAPKIFVRSHAQTEVWSRRYAACQELTPADRNISLVNMSFHAGRSMNLVMLHVGGTVVVPRYRNLDELVAQVLEARITYLNAPWFHPGDLAAMNDAGYVFFKGRADDIINNAGVKFYPAEVETVLLAHPEVVEAAVFGWPCPLHGDVAVACLVTRAALTARDLRQFCARRIAAHKIPHAFLFVPELPKIPMGKILKSRLKQELGQQINERLR